MLMPVNYPTRIVCLTEETTETLYLLGEERRIVGISGFTVRPPRARREKPKVSAFTSAKIDKIVELQPDLVLGFSDLQADIAAELIRAGIEVHVFNHRSVAEILRMIATLGAMVGCAAKAAALADELESGLDAIRAGAARFARRPRVYFEEWDEPQISGIRWVSELIGIAGGEDCFPGVGTRAAGQESHHRRPARGDASCARRDLRLLVRQEIPSRARRGTARLERSAGCARRPPLRDQVVHHPAARARGADRRCAGNARAPGALGGQAVRRLSASRYFSLVLAMTSGGSFGPGDFLFQSSVSR